MNYTMNIKSIISACGKAGYVNRFPVILLWLALALSVSGCSKSKEGPKQEQEQPSISEQLQSLPFVATLEKAEHRQLVAGVDLYEVAFKNSTESPYALFILRIDLKRDDLTLRTLTPKDEPEFGLQRVLDMAKLVNSSSRRVVAAVNGDFFEWTGKPWGPVVKDGNIIKGDFNAPDRNYFAIHQDKTLSIGGPGNFITGRATIDQAIGGLERTLRSGSLSSHPNTERHPRTLVGYTANKEVYLVVVDGRRSGYSGGFTHNEGGQLLKALGAVESLNLDGGGSTTLVIEDPATKQLVIKNRHSDASPRAVANGLAIIQTAD